MRIRIYRRVRSVSAGEGFIKNFSNQSLDIVRQKMNE